MDAIDIIGKPTHSKQAVETNQEETMRKATVLISILVVLTTGCASYRPIVDMQGVNSVKYEQDLRDCQNYAKQVSPATSSIVGGAIGAGAGALLGLVVGSYFGRAGEFAGMGAAVGGTSGGMSGAAEGARSQMDIIRRCMAGRGYRVLQ
ncbi:glycine zipper family protein [Desulfonatronum thioautotrophicum]|uniref:glycine zipper family protein n=1 Tax=Desulfonatronum thioautotrophicum TaxID=617001 RepID=UPI00069A9FB3|nr:glycine zipper family protein [Desulfonatronum thioautotrophicum]